VVAIDGSGGTTWSVVVVSVGEGKNGRKGRRTMEIR